MQKLEERARQLAEEEAAKAKPDKGILFVRSDATNEETGRMEDTVNPEEIHLDLDSDEEGEDTGQGA